MHGSVLQNEDYIEFADDNTVEVLALSRLEEGIQKGDRKAATYEGKDDQGNPVQYLVSWPNLTVEDVKACGTSKAGTYNKTGKIPYTSIVDPHTEEELQGMSGGRSSGQLMEAVAVHRKNLEAKYGPSLPRSKIRKLEAEAAKVREALAKGGAAKALPALEKLAKSHGGGHPALEKRVEELRAAVMEAARAELDQAENLISEGDAAGAKRILNPLRRILKGTDLAERVESLFAQASAPN